MELQSSHSLVQSFGSDIDCFSLFLKKVKYTLVQALMLCTGRTVHRRSRGIALLFNDQQH